MSFSKKNIHSDNMKKAAMEAVSHGKLFSKKLDFSDSSIKFVEEILSLYANDLDSKRSTVSPMTEKQIWSMSMMWGAYIGETLLRNHLKSFIWNVNKQWGPYPILIRDEKNILGTYKQSI